MKPLTKSLFFDTGLVMFQGASSALVQFWESKGMLAAHLSTVSPRAPWPKPRGKAAAPQQRTVEVASPRDQLLLNVQVMVFLLGVGGVGHDRPRVKHGDTPPSYFCARALLRDSPRFFLCQCSD